METDLIAILPTHRASILNISLSAGYNHHHHHTKHEPTFSFTRPSHTKERRHPLLWPQYSLKRHSARRRHLGCRSNHLAGDRLEPTSIARKAAAARSEMRVWPRRRRQMRGSKVNVRESSGAAPKTNGRNSRTRCRNGGRIPHYCHRRRAKLEMAEVGLVARKDGNGELFFLDRNGDLALSLFDGLPTALVRLKNGLFWSTYHKQNLLDGRNSAT